MDTQSVVWAPWVVAGCAVTGLLGHACLNATSLPGSSTQVYRRCRNTVSELLHTTSLWQKTLKVIGGKFGTSVLSYFNFLRWLLKFNIFSFVVNLGFLVIPQLTVAQKNTLQFTGLEFFTGAVSPLFPGPQVTPASPGTHLDPSRRPFCPLMGKVHFKNVPEAQ